MMMMMMMMHGCPLPLNKPSLLCTLTVMTLCLSFPLTPSHPTLPYNFEPKLVKDQQLSHSSWKNSLQFISSLFKHLIPQKDKAI